MTIHTIEVCDDLMCVMDSDGNGHDCHELCSLRKAKRLLRRWQDKYTFDYAEALCKVSEFFADEAKAWTSPSHLDYAEEAEAAQRAEAWPQAAALWRRARDVVRASDDLSRLQARTFRLKYKAAADA